MNFSHRINGLDRGGMVLSAGGVVPACPTLPPPRVAGPRPPRLPPDDVALLTDTGRSEKMTRPQHRRANTGSLMERQG